MVSGVGKSLGSSASDGLRSLGNLGKEINFFDRKFSLEDEDRVVTKHDLKIYARSPNALWFEKSQLWLLWQYFVLVNGIFAIIAISFSVHCHIGSPTMTREVLAPLIDLATDDNRYLVLITYAV